MIISLENPFFGLHLSGRLRQVWLYVLYGNASKACFTSALRMPRTCLRRQIFGFCAAAVRCLSQPQYCRTKIQGRNAAATSKTKYIRKYRVARLPQRQKLNVRHGHFLQVGNTSLLICSLFYIHRTTCSCDVATGDITYSRDREAGRRQIRLESYRLSRVHTQGCCKMGMQYFQDFYKDKARCRTVHAGQPIFSYSQHSCGSLAIHRTLSFR